MKRSARFQLTIQIGHILTLLKTAKARSLTIPPAVLARVDEIIQ